MHSSSSHIRARGQKIENMTSAQFNATVKDPRSTWDNVELEISRLGALKVAFFENGHAQPLVMRALRESRGEQLLALGWSPVESFQSGRKALPRECDWLVPALAGQEALARERLVAHRKMNLPKSSWFFACARDKNMPGLTWLLDRFPSQKESDAWWGAMKVGWEDGIDLLLSRGFTVDVAEPSSGKTALHLSVEARNMSLARFLLSRGADPNANDGRSTWVAASAIQKDAPDLLLELIQAGLTMDVSLPRANTWISLAYEAGSPACALLLVEAGATLSKADERLLTQLKRTPSWHGVLAALEARTLNEETRPSSIRSAVRRI
jgi:hypothetical protein